MKKLFTLFSLFLAVNAGAQISPQNSPYVNDGIYSVVADSVNVPNSVKVLMYRPSVAPSGNKYPTFIFQPGANGFFQTSINVHSYDVYMKHLASWGYVVLVLDQTTAGLPNGSDFKTVFTWFKTTVADNTHWLNTYATASNVFVGGHSNGGVNASALVAANGSPTEVNGIVYFASYPSNNFLVTQDVSGYAGYVLDLAGNDDATTALADAKEGYDKYTSAACAVWVNITGADHGAFGDYVNSSQPVGAIGRADATATVRHYLLSFMQAYAKNDQNGKNNLNDAALRPTTTTEFINPCAVTTAIAGAENGIAYSVQPNPGTSEMQLSFSAPVQLESLNLLNVAGQTVNAEWTSSDNVVYNVNTGALASGTYYYQGITRDGQSFSGKWLKY